MHAVDENFGIICLKAIRDNLVCDQGKDEGTQFFGGGISKRS